MALSYDIIVVAIPNPLHLSAGDAFGSGPPVSNNESQGRGLKGTQNGDSNYAQKSYSYHDLKHGEAAGAALPGPPCSTSQP